MKESLCVALSDVQWAPCNPKYKSTNNLYLGDLMGLQYNYNYPKPEITKTLGVVSTLNLQVEAASTARPAASQGRHPASLTGLRGV